MKVKPKIPFTAHFYDGKNPIPEMMTFYNSDDREEYCNLCNCLNKEHGYLHFTDGFITICPGAYVIYDEEGEPFDFAINETEFAEKWEVVCETDKMKPLNIWSKEEVEAAKQEAERLQEILKWE